MFIIIGRMKYFITSDGKKLFALKRGEINGFWYITPQIMGQIGTLDYGEKSYSKKRIIFSVVQKLLDSKW